MSYPQSKTIMVLANSLKKGGRCVAGLEAKLTTSGYYELGSWIRPIDPGQKEGTIPGGRTLIGGRFLKPLDLVKISFRGPANDPFHPEDVEIDCSKDWAFEGEIDPNVFTVLPDESEDLWGPSTAANRKVTPKAGIKTLRLIKPQGKIYARAYADHTPWGIKHRRILHVHHQGVTHQFSIDDPSFGRRYNLSPAEVGDRDVKIELDPAKTVVIASLTKPFEKDGLQYKIAASIIEL